MAGKKKTTSKKKAASKKPTAKKKTTAKKSAAPKKASTKPSAKKKTAKVKAAVRKAATRRASTGKYAYRASAPLAPPPKRHEAEILPFQKFVSENDISVLLRVSSRGQSTVSYNHLKLVLDEISEVAYDLEVAELKSVHSSFPEIPDDFIGAVSSRLRRYKDSVIRLSDVRRGSIEVAIIVTGICLWGLQVTLGETIKEAWLQSDMHERLKEFLSKRRGAKRKRLESDMADRLKHLPIAGLEVKVQSSDGLITLLVIIDEAGV